MRWLPIDPLWCNGSTSAFGAVRSGFESWRRSMFPVRHLTQSIARAPEDVVAFAGDPANLPRWASGLSSGIREEHGEWITDSPMGDADVEADALTIRADLDRLRSLLEGSG